VSLKFLWYVCGNPGPVSSVEFLTINVRDVTDVVGKNGNKKSTLRTNLEGRSEP
jgi:hypothetical protein